MNEALALGIEFKGDIKKLSTQDKKNTSFEIQNCCQNSKGNKIYKVQDLTGLGIG